MLERLIIECDVLFENFAPGALDRIGFTWPGTHSGTEPENDHGFDQGVWARAYEDRKVYRYKLYGRDVDDTYSTFNLLDSTIVL